MFTASASSVTALLSTQLKNLMHRLKLLSLLWSVDLTLYYPGQLQMQIRMQLQITE
jgi:hypothetical protein